MKKRLSNHARIKEKIQSNFPERWWGDDFDSRFFLISKVSKIKGKTILDIGGGVGIISSELDKDNLIINLDFSFEDLKICNQKEKGRILTLCGYMTHIPFSDNSFDCIISGSVLQYAKADDLKNDQIIKKSINEYPSVKKSLNEIHRVLKPNGILYMVTPNNLFYQSYMLNYDELKSELSKIFVKYSLFFYNTLPHLSKRYKKFNLANSIPKIISKFINPDKVISLLIKEDNGFEKNSISFYVKAIKN